MKTTLDLPDALLKKIKIQAVHEGKKLKDLVAELLTRGYDAPSPKTRTRIKADKALLRRRKELSQKFVSGEWGVELAGFEAATRKDQKKDRQRAQAWRQ